jgi:hypothetical protein
VYLGDYADATKTVYFAFTTNASDGTRTSLSAALEEADIAIFKNGSIMTLTAATITVTANPTIQGGGAVGVYLVSVNMNNDADFTTGADYTAILYPNDETVDSKAPASVLAHWSVANRITAGIKTDTAAILVDTNELQTDWTNGGRLDLIVDDILLDTAEIGAAGAGLTNINLPDQTMNITGNITGNLSGSVGSVTGAVGSVTGAVGSVTGAVGSVTGNVGGNVSGSVGSVVAEVDADVKKINAVTVIGTGTAGDLWRA